MELVGKLAIENKSKNNGKGAKSAGVEQPNLKALPRHVAVIMDGNRRWAKKRFWRRVRGHREGARALLDTMRYVNELGVEYLTCYAFSKENWSRPKDEVNEILRLLRKHMLEDTSELHERKIRIRIVGDLDDLDESMRTRAIEVMEETKHYTRTTLNLCISYGGRWELTEAVRRIATEVKQGTLRPEDINEQTITDHLLTADMPDPDLLIRTSGEVRLSNYLLWQLSYAEFIFIDTFWPDFRRGHMQKCIVEYQKRTRRFGGWNDEDVSVEVNAPTEPVGAS